MAHQKLSQASPALLLACFLGIAGLLVSGCTSRTPPQAATTVTATPGGSASPAAPEASPTAGSTSTPSGGASQEGEPPAEAQASLASLIAAGKTALASVPGAIKGIESDHGGMLWEVTILSKDGAEHEVKVAADGSIVSETERKQLGLTKVDPYKEFVDSVKLDFAQAAEAMIKAVPQGFILELGLDSSGGTNVWEAEIRDGSQNREISLDAVTGDVIKNEVDI